MREDKILEDYKFESYLEGILFKLLLTHAS